MTESPAPPSPAHIERQFRDAHRRARRHWFEDGITELLTGSLFLVLALYFLLASRVTGNSLGGVIVSLLLPLLVIGGSLGIRRLLRRAKETLVYTRTGYVTYRDTHGRRRGWVAGLLGAVISALMVVLIRQAPGIEAWLPALQGFLLGGVFLLMARSVSLPRLSVTAAVSALAGLIISLVRVPTAPADALLFGAVGLALAGSGLLALRRFLRQGPPPEQM